MLEHSKNHSIEKAYLRILESQNSTVVSGNDRENASGKPKKNWSMITAVNRRREAERRRLLVPAEFSSSMKFDGDRNAITLSGAARNKILQEANSTRNGIGDLSIELHLSDDGKRLIFDLSIYPLVDWDAEPFNAVSRYFTDCAPWISTHNTKRLVEQRISFLRYELEDEMVLNKARKLLGRDSERTDYEQMELFPDMKK